MMWMNVKKVENKCERAKREAEQERRRWLFEVTPVCGQGALKLSSVLMLGA
jgi:hypothetical protein